MKTIYLDLDDTVFDTENHMRQLLGGKWLNHKGLLYQEYENFTAKERVIVAGMFADYLSIPFKEGAIEGLNTLSKKYDIIFCSSAQGRLEHIAKEDFARQVGIPIIVCTAVKTGVNMKGSVFVDNRGDHLDSSDADIRVLFYKEGCSGSLVANRVVYNWVELVEYLMSL